jgi:hypothetical protein
MLDFIECKFGMCGRTNHHQNLGLVVVVWNGRMTNGHSDEGRDNVDVLTSIRLDEGVQRFVRDRSAVFFCGLAEDPIGGNDVYSTGRVGYIKDCVPDKAVRDVYSRFRGSKWGGPTKVIVSHPFAMIRTYRMLGYLAFIDPALEFLSDAFRYPFSDRFDVAQSLFDECDNVGAFGPAQNRLGGRLDSVYLPADCVPLLAEKLLSHVVRKVHLNHVRAGQPR